MVIDQFVAAGQGGLFEDAQGHVREHPLEGFSVVDSASLAVYDNLEGLTGRSSVEEILDEAAYFCEKYGGFVPDG